MKTLTYKIIGALLCFNALNIYASEKDEPIAIDSRIKTFVYSENEIFPVVLHYGYQTAIEFGKEETIQTYSVGNQFVWQFSAVGRTLFIRPLEDNIVTNMTVITNKRRYYFELYSKMTSNSGDEELSYVVRFFYPDGSNDKIKVKPNQQEQIKDTHSLIKPYNFNYEISGVNKEVISMVFDNGMQTFYKIENTKMMQNNLKITCDNSNIDAKFIGSYLMINKICKKSDINLNGKKIVINKK